MPSATAIKSASRNRERGRDALGGRRDAYPATAHGKRIALPSHSPRPPYARHGVPSPPISQSGQNHLILPSGTASGLLGRATLAKVSVWLQSARLPGSRPAALSRSPPRACPRGRKSKLSCWRGWLRPHPLRLITGVDSALLSISHFSLHSIGVILGRRGRTTALDQFVADLFIQGQVSLRTILPMDSRHSPLARPRRRSLELWYPFCPK
jgi:hypothetical protein